MLNPKPITTAVLLSLLFLGCESEHEQHREEELYADDDDEGGFTHELPEDLFTLPQPKRLWSVEQHPASATFGDDVVVLIYDDDRFEVRNRKTGETRQTGTLPRKFPIAERYKKPRPHSGLQQRSLSRLVLADSLFVFIDQATLVAMSLKDGTEIWRYDASTLAAFRDANEIPTVTALHATDGGLMATFSQFSESVSCSRASLDSSGNVRWTEDYKGLCGVLDPKQMVLYHADPRGHRIVITDRSTDHKRTEKQFVVQDREQLSMRGDLIVAFDRSVFEIFSHKTGEKMHHARGRFQGFVDEKSVLVDVEEGDALLNVATDTRTHVWDWGLTDYLAHNEQYALYVPHAQTIVARVDLKTGERVFLDTFPNDRGVGPIDSMLMGRDVFDMTVSSEPRRKTESLEETVHEILRAKTNKTSYAIGQRLKRLDGETLHKIVDPTLSDVPLAEVSGLTDYVSDEAIVKRVASELGRGEPSGEAAKALALLIKGRSAPESREQLIAYAMKHPDDTEWQEVMGWLIAPHHWKKAYQCSYQEKTIKKLVSYAVERLRNDSSFIVVNDIYNLANLCTDSPNLAQPIVDEIRKRPLAPYGPQDTAPPEHSYISEQGNVAIVTQRIFAYDHHLWVMRHRDGEWSKPRYTGIVTSALMREDPIRIIEIEEGFRIEYLVEIPYDVKREEKSFTWEAIDLDSDGDGWTDIFEKHTSHTDPQNADSDGDGVDDPSDGSPHCAREAESEEEKLRELTMLFLWVYVYPPMMQMNEDPCISYPLHSNRFIKSVDEYPYRIEISTPAPKPRTVWEQIQDWRDDNTALATLPTPKPEWRNAPYRQARFVGLRYDVGSSPNIGFRKIEGTWRPFFITDSEARHIETWGPP